MNIVELYEKIEEIVQNILFIETLNKNDRKAIILIGNPNSYLMKELERKLGEQFRIYLKIVTPTSVIACRRRGEMHQLDDGVTISFVPTSLELQDKIDFYVGEGMETFLVFDLLKKGEITS